MALEDDEDFIVDANGNRLPKPPPAPPAAEKPPFDPTAAFEPVADEKPAFDPTKPFEPVKDDKPAFDPDKPFEEGVAPKGGVHKPTFTSYEEWMAPVGQAFANLPRRAAQVHDYAKLLFQKPVDYIMGDDTPSKEIAAQLAQRSKELSADRDVVVEASGKAGGVATDVATAAVDLIPQLLLSGGSALAFNGAKTAVTTSAALGGMQSASGAFASNVARRVEAGEDIGKAADAELIPSLASGAVTAAVTKAFGATGIESIFAKEGARGVVSRGVQVLSSAGAEGMEEMTDELAQKLVDLTSGKNVDLKQATYEVLYNGAIGSFLGAGVKGMHVISESRRPENEEALAAASRARTVAPQTASTLENIVRTEIQEGAENVKVTPTQGSGAVAPAIGLSSRQSVDGGFEHSLNIAAGTTPEQIRAFASQIDFSHLPDDQADALRAQLDEAALAARDAAPAPTGAPAAAAPAAVAPERAAEIQTRLKEIASEGTTAANAAEQARLVQELGTAAPAGPAPVESPAAEAPSAPIAGPVLTDPDGNILTQGKIGETHAELLAKAVATEQDPAKLDAIIAAADNDAQHMFVDDNGAVHTREAAAPRAIEHGQADPDVTILQSQNLRVRPSTLNPDRPIPPTITGQLPPPPSEYDVAKQAFLALPPEERDRQITANRDKITAEATKTGILPRLGQIRADAGKGAREFWDALKAQMAETFPPEPLPEGAKEVQVKIEGGKDKLPAISEGGKVRPRFTNDAAITAKQLDAGVIGTGAGTRLYIPDEIMDSDTLNPAINPVFDSERGLYFVESVKHEFGEIHKPGDLAALLKENEKEAPRHTRWYSSATHRRSKRCRTPTPPARVRMTRRSGNSWPRLTTRFSRTPASLRNTTLSTLMPTRLRRSHRAQRSRLPSRLGR
jgi:hypothetical protein